MGRVLITGGLGHLGGRIADHLAKAGCAVVVASHRPPGPGETLPPGTVRATFALDDPPAIEAALRGVDSVVHLAALGDAESNLRPHDAYRVTTLGTLHMIEACRAAGTRRFVYMSTAQVYGRALAGAVHEGVVPRPVNHYATTHRAAEDIVLAAADRGEVEGVVLRLSNAVGRPFDPALDRWRPIAHDLARQAVVERRLTLRSTGMQWRDFVPLSEAGRAVSHILDLPAQSLGDGLFNLGAGSSLRVMDLVTSVAERCATELGFRPPVTSRPPEDDPAPPPRFDYRVDRLRGAGFDPATDLDAEIVGLLSWARERWDPARPQAS